MRITVKLAITVMVFLGTFCMLRSTPAAATLLALQVGMEGPEFSLQNLEGKQQALAGLKAEKLTVLVFWSTWSKKSEKLLARMQKLFEKYKQQGLAIIGINVDQEKISRETLLAIRSVENNLKISYPMLVDDHLAVFHDYGVIALPTTIVMDKERLVKFELSGYPLVGSEMMVDYISSTIEGKKPVVVEEKGGYKPNKNAVRFFKMGIASQKSKRMADKAEMWFKKACEADAEFILPHISLGRIYTERGDTSSAQAEYKKVLAKEPKNPVALCEAGMIMVNEGKFQEGNRLFEAARKEEETYLPCYYYAGYAYWKEGKLTEALKMFDEAEKNNPTDYKTWVYKGRMFEEQKDAKKAADSYRKALHFIIKD